jgi:UDP-GlcNAc:undecaprenyl-phosphate GlcNAc-1-phosphate transferase
MAEARLLPGALLPVLVVVLLTAFLLAPLCRRLALRIRLIDRPRQDRFHAVATPKLGGLVVMAAAAPWLVRQSWTELERGSPGVVAAVVGGLLLAFATGLLDDLRQLAPRWKFLGQLLAGLLPAVALTTVADGGWLAAVPDPILVLAGTLGVVGFQNAVNFLDNMDGIAGGVSAIALVCLAPLLMATGLTPVALVLAAAIIGFLPSNVASPARLFLGDAGSLPLGYAMGVLAWASVVAAPGAGWAGGAAAMVMIPVVDITFVTVVRLREGRSPAVGGRDHTTHRVFVLVGSPRRTWVLYWGLAAGLGALGILTARAGGAWGVGLLGLVGVAGIVAGERLSRVPIPDR